MSEETTREADDAATVAAWQKFIATIDRDLQTGGYTENNPQPTGDFEAIGAALRHIDALQRQLDAATARAEGLRAVLEDVFDTFASVPEEFDRMHLRVNREGIFPNGTVYSMYAKKTADTIQGAKAAMRALAPAAPDSAGDGDSDGGV